MADKKFNDENLAKLAEEYNQNKKKSLSDFSEEEFEAFFSQQPPRRAASRRQQPAVTPQKVHVPEPQKTRAPAPQPRRQEYYDSEDQYYEEYDDSANASHVPAAPKAKTGVFSGFMYFVFVLSLSIILACIGWVAACDILALNKDVVNAEVTLPQEIFTQETKTVTGSDGTSSTVNYNKADMGKVAKILKDAGIIEYKSLFLLYSDFSNADEKLDPGTYELSTIYDYRAIVKKMQYGSGAMVTTEITFPEGMTMEEIFAELEDKQVCSAADLEDCAANMDFGYSFLEDLPYGDSTRLEGYLFPDTYEFYQGSNAQTTLDTFLQTFNNKITAEMREKAANSKYSLNQIIIIASMIESEAGSDDERATIASVIYNRLKSGMPLQIDATIQYALPERKEKLSDDDLKVDSPYNTYTHKGLPPTAISNPGIKSIQAALSPATTNYYYYALDTATGTHKFFTNSSDFEAFKKTQNYG